MQGRHQAENHLGAEAKNHLFSKMFISLSFFLKTSSYLTVAISAPTPSHPRWWPGPRPRGWWAQEGGANEPGHELPSVQHRMDELTVHFIGCGAAVEATWGHAWVPCERVLS